VTFTITGQCSGALIVTFSISSLTLGVALSKPAIRLPVVAEVLMLKPVAALFHVGD